MMLAEVTHRFSGLWAPCEVGHGVMAAGLGDLLPADGQAGGGRLDVVEAGGIAAQHLAFDPLGEGRVAEALLPFGRDLEGPEGIGGLVGWKSNQGEVELLLNTDTDKLSFKHKQNGTTAAKTTLRMPIDTDVLYHIRITYDDSFFYIFLGNGTAPLLTFKTTMVPSGKMGVRLKPTAGSVSVRYDNILQY